MERESQGSKLTFSGHSLCRGHYRSQELIMNKLDQNHTFNIIIIINLIILCRNNYARLGFFLSLFRFKSGSAASSS